MNNASIMGRLTADPELRKTVSGKSVTSFCVAVPRHYDKEQVDYIDCVAWGKQAEFVSKYFSKGKMIAIEGEIQTRKYEDKQGRSRKATEIRVEKVSFCGGKDTESHPKEEVQKFSEIIEEELPF